jgi:hypothetical protein
MKGKDIAYEKYLEVQEALNAQIANEALRDALFQAFDKLSGSELNSLIKLINEYRAKRSDTFE